MHPYIMGVPHRAKQVRRIFEHIANRSDVKIWSGEQILAWYQRCKGRA